MCCGCSLKPARVADINALNCALVVDKSTKLITQVSQLALDFFGKTAKNIIGHHIDEFLPLAETGAGKTTAHEIQILTANALVKGRPIPVHIKMQDQGNNRIISFIDNTEHALLKAALPKFTYTLVIVDEDLIVTDSVESFGFELNPGTKLIDRIDPALRATFEAAITEFKGDSKLPVTSIQTSLTKRLTPYPVIICLSKIAGGGFKVIILFDSEKALQQHTDLKTKSVRHILGNKATEVNGATDEMKEELDRRGQIDSLSRQAADAVKQQIAVTDAIQAVLVFLSHPCHDIELIPRPTNLKTLIPLWVQSSNITVTFAEGFPEGKMDVKKIFHRSIITSVIQLLTKNTGAKIEIHVAKLDEIIQYMFKLNRKLTAEEQTALKENLASKTELSVNICLINMIKGNVIHTFDEDSNQSSIAINVPEITTFTPSVESIGSSRGTSLANLLDYISQASESRPSARGGEGEETKLDRLEIPYNTPTHGSTEANTILIVDDERSIRKTYERFANTWTESEKLSGIVNIISVKGVADLKTKLDSGVIKVNEIFLVLMDQMMPFEDIGAEWKEKIEEDGKTYSWETAEGGLRSTRILRESKFKGPIVLSSGNTEALLINNILLTSLNLKGYETQILAKPVSMRTFKGVVSLYVPKALLDQAKGTEAQGAGEVKETGKRKKDAAAQRESKRDRPSAAPHRGTIKSGKKLPPIPPDRRRRYSTGSTDISNFTKLTSLPGTPSEEKPPT